MIRPQIILAVWLLSLLAAFGAGWQWKGDRAEVRETRADLKQAKAETVAVEQARAVEQKQGQAQQTAADIADKREAQINADYDARLASAGDGGDNGRLSQLWGKCETDRLSERAATAAEAARQDRLRRESAARIVRDVESAQSERDEVIHRYQALEYRPP